MKGSKMMKAFFSILSVYSTPMSLHEFDRTHFQGALSYGLYAPLASKLLESRGVVLHPFFAQGHNFRYEIGTEHGVSALLAHTLGDLLENIDIGYIASECNISEEELAFLNKYKDSQPIALLLGRDLYFHPHAEFIAHTLGRLSTKCQIRFFVQDFTPIPHTNHTQEILNTDILESLPDNNGAYVYLLKDNDCKDLGESVLLIPETFGAIFKVQDNTMVSIQFEYSDEIIHTKARFCHSLKGTIALLKTSQILNYPFRKILSLNV